MSAIVPKVRWSVKQRLLRQLRRCRDAALRIRYLIIINLLNGRGAYATAQVLGIHNTTIYRVAKRFRDHGEWGLIDGREDSGSAKLDERFLATLYKVSVPRRNSTAGVVRPGRGKCWSPPWHSKRGFAFIRPR